MADEDQQIQLSARDEGVGIPAAELDLLFERFFRASTSKGIAGADTDLGGFARRHHQRAQSGG